MNKKTKANPEIRERMASNHLTMWEVAARIGIGNSTFSAWMRLPLDEERTQRTMDAINELVAEQEG